MRRALGILVVLSLNHQHLLGQAPVDSGQSVRITSLRHDMNAEIGRVLAATADTIVIEVTGVRTMSYRQVYRTDTLALPLATIDRLEVSRHGGHRAGRGAVIGLGVGAAAGLVYGMATYEPCPPDNFACPILATQSAAQQGVMFSATFGLVGAGIGALIGSTVRGDRWERVPLRMVSVRSLPGDHLGLGVTATF